MAVDYEKEGKIAIFTINRPDAMNSLSAQVHKELTEAMIDFRDDPSLWVGIITGAGEKAFSAGADIKEFRSGSGTVEPARADVIWKPFIAAINGYALGGGLELAMTCDLRIAAEHARLGQPEVNIGYMPGNGATQRLPRFIPRAKAAEMMLMGQLIDAQEAYRIGLVNKIVPFDQLMSTAQALADKINENGPLAVRAVKKAAYSGLTMPLNEGFNLETLLGIRVRQSEDAWEGPRAFAEKRKPVYKGSPLHRQQLHFQ